MEVSEDCPLYPKRAAGHWGPLLLPWDKEAPKKWKTLVRLLPQQGLQCQGFLRGQAVAAFPGGLLRCGLSQASLPVTRKEHRSCAAGGAYSLRVRTAGLGMGSEELVLEAAPNFWQLQSGAAIEVRQLLDP